MSTATVSIRTATVRVSNIAIELPVDCSLIPRLNAIWAAGDRKLLRIFALKPKEAELLLSCYTINECKAYSCTALFSF
jgi:hypothetical protein